MSDCHDRDEPAEPKEAPADQADCLRQAADAVRFAEEQLHQAKEGYQRLRTQAAEQIEALRKKTLGDVVDGTLTAVRRHPGAGVLLSMLVGYFVGRLFRK